MKVVVFASANPDFFIAHADVDMLQHLSTKAVPRNEGKLDDLARVLARISQLPQSTIAQIKGYARGGGHEFALACDMGFAARGKAIFMQMEVGMGILPYGGGASRMARQVGLGNALEIILSAKVFNADKAEALDTINKALEPDKIGLHVSQLANRISQFPAASTTACKRAVDASIDLPIAQALEEKTALSSNQPNPSSKALGSSNGISEQIGKPKNSQTHLMGLQEVK